MTTYEHVNGSRSQNSSAFPPRASESLRDQDGPLKRPLTAPLIMAGTCTCGVIGETFDVDYCSAPTFARTFCRTDGGSGA